MMMMTSSYAKYSPSVCLMLALLSGESLQQRWERHTGRIQFSPVRGGRWGVEKLFQHNLIFSAQKLPNSFIPSLIWFILKSWKGCICPGVRIFFAANKLFSIPHFLSPQRELVPPFIRVFQYYSFSHYIDYVNCVNISLQCHNKLKAHKNKSNQYFIVGSKEHLRILGLRTCEVDGLIWLFKILSSHSD